MTKKHIIYVPPSLVSTDRSMVWTRIESDVLPDDTLANHVVNKFNQYDTADMERLRDYMADDTTADDAVSYLLRKWDELQHVPYAACALAKAIKALRESEASHE